MKLNQGHDRLFPIQQNLGNTNSGKRQTVRVNSGSSYRNRLNIKFATYNCRIVTDFQQFREYSTVQIYLFHQKRR